MRTVIGAEIVEELVELRLVFLFEDSEGAGQTVPGRIPGGSGFPFSGARARRGGGVLPIGEDLRGACHFVFIMTTRVEISGADELLISLVSGVFSVKSRYYYRPVTGVSDIAAKPL